MKFEIPQIIYTTLTVIGMGVAIGRYGEPKRRDTYDLVDVIVAPAIVFSLLWWGGFYSHV